MIREWRRVIVVLVGVELATIVETNCHRACHTIQGTRTGQICPTRWWQSSSSQHRENQQQQQQMNSLYRWLAVFQIRIPPYQRPRLDTPIVTSSFTHISRDHLPPPRDTHPCVDYGNYCLSSQDQETEDQSTNPRTTVPAITTTNAQIHNLHRMHRRSTQSRTIAITTYTPHHNCLEIDERSSSLTTP